MNNNIKNMWYIIQYINESKNIILQGEINNVNIPYDLKLDLSTVCEGIYLLTVWGNYDTSIHLGELHQNNEEQTDIVMASEILTIGKGWTNNILLNMRRIKGALFIAAKNLPTDIVQVSQTITNATQSINNELTYYGNTTVYKNFTILAPDTAMLQTLLAPTAEGEISNLLLQFHNDNLEESIIEDHFELGIYNE